MEIILGTIVIGIAILGLALGVLFGGRSLRGSCGDTDSCTLCHGDASKCESNPQTSEFI